MSAFFGESLLCLRGERLVFADLSFGLDPGDALVLSGANGSGKSSLLRVMAGLLRPAAGRILWDGADIFRDREAHHARLHYLGHLDAVKPALSVLENLTFASALRGVSDMQGLSDALAFFGLRAISDRPARLLSQGQRRRLALSRLLAAPAPLWLLDEPSVGLDTASVDALVEAVERRRQSGGIVIMATHQALPLEGALGLNLDDFAPVDDAGAHAPLEMAW